MDSVLVPDGTAIRTIPQPSAQVTPRQSNMEQLTTACTRVAADSQDLSPRENDPVSTTRRAARSVQHNFTQIEQNNQETIESVISSLLNQDISFAVDENSNICYVEVTDKATDKLLRTIPSESMRKVLENIDRHIEEVLNENIEESRGLLLDTSR